MKKISGATAITGISELKPEIKSEGKTTLDLLAGAARLAVSDAGLNNYIYAMVELEEGIKMPANILGCELEKVTVGMPVELSIQERANIRDLDHAVKRESTMVVPTGSFLCNKSGDSNMLP